MMRRFLCILALSIYTLSGYGQINTDRVMTIGRNALYFEDYVLAIQYFNQVIRSKPWMAEPYFYRGVAKISLDDFKGAEEDCTASIERNPFLAQAYYARGIARQSQENYDGAIADYEKGLEYKTDDRLMLSNMAIAYIQKKDFDGAEKVFDKLVSAYPRESSSYLPRAAMYLEKGDTVNALKDYDKAIELDPYFAPSYGNRAIVYYQTNRLEDALKDLNEAIRLSMKETGYYINRGLVRYQLNDLRGAMSDYDEVINVEKHNMIARFNRGLLRFQVGEYNGAIEDFTDVIEQEPDNYMAYYNRALLRFQVGDFPGAVDDYDVVLAEYPMFIPGYYSRSEAKRKMNDVVGADKDYWKAFEMEKKMRDGSLKNETQLASSDDKQDSNAGASANPTSPSDNTREQSDENIEKFNRLVVYDKEEERKSKYKNEFRGRVQDRNVRIDLEKSFVLSYYEKSDPVKRLIYYDKMVDDFNNAAYLNYKLILTNDEAALTEDQIATHFNSINNYSSVIEKDPGNAIAYFGRGLDYMLVQDFVEAIKDFNRAIELNSSFTLAYFCRAVVRNKQMTYNQYEKEEQKVSVVPMETPALSKGSNIAKAREAQEAIENKQQSQEHEMIMRDYDMVIKQNPSFVYAYFNRGNMRCNLRDFRAAIADYDEAIRRDPEFAEAYFNRGLSYLSLGNINQGIRDLSKAGELGIYNAYSIIKRMARN